MFRKLVKDEGNFICSDSVCGSEEVRNAVVGAGEFGPAAAAVETISWCAPVAFVVKCEAVETSAVILQVEPMSAVRARGSAVLRACVASTVAQIAPLAAW